MEHLNLSRKVQLENTKNETIGLRNHAEDNPAEV